MALKQLVLQRIENLALQKTETKSLCHTYVAAHENLKKSENHVESSIMFAFTSRTSVTGGTREFYHEILPLKDYGSV
jgi:hypothetical protein